MYKSYSYHDMPEPLPVKPKPLQKPAQDQKISSGASQDNSLKKIFGGMELDDIILLAVIFMLISNDCDDKLLLIALAYVFIAGYVN